jgi:hypothetical protein
VTIHISAWDEMLVDDRLDVRRAGIGKALISCMQMARQPAQSQAWFSLWIGAIGFVAILA